MWNMESGLKLVRALDTQAKDYGFHLALGGSVLRKGESTKDIDLYFLPYDNPDFPEKPDELIAWLTRIWGTPERIDVEYSKTTLPPGVHPDSIWNISADDPVPAGYRLRSKLQPDESTIFYHEPTPGFRGRRPQPKKSKRYNDKLKFIRPGGERIDVFIV